MAKTPANRSTTKSGSVTPAKGTLYSWGDKRGAVHSVSLKQHKSNVKVKSSASPSSSTPPPIGSTDPYSYATTYGSPIDPSQSLTSPLTTQQALGLAGAQADQTYGPQIATNKSLQNSVPAWFQNYMDTNKANQAAQQSYAAPILANAQSGVTNAAAPTPGLAPGSPQAATDAQAGSGRAALAQLGADTLAATQNAANQYYGAQQSTAAQQLPQAQTALAQQGAQLQAQRGQAVTSNFGTIRSGEQNYGIAQATLAGNIANQTTDNAISQENADTNANAPTVAATTKANTPITTGPFAGYTPAQVLTLSDAKKAQLRAAAKKTSGSAVGSDGLTATQRAAKKAAASHTAAIHKSTGSVQNKVTDISSALGTKFKVTTDTPTMAPDPVTGKPKVTGYTKGSRSSTPAEQRAAAVKKYGATLVEISSAISKGTPLTSDQIRYLHNTDPNLRIPSAWLHGKAKQSPGISSDPGPK